MADELHRCARGDGSAWWRLATVAVVLGALLLVAPVAGAQAFEGMLTERHGDRFGAAPTSTGYVLDSGTVDRPLVDDQPHALVGQRVTVQDADPSTAALEGRARPAGQQRIVAAPVAGPRSLLILVLTFPDAPAPAATAEQARSAVFTGPDSPNALFKQQAEGATHFVGRLRLDGDVAGPLRLSMTLGGCRVDEIAAAADAAAASSGWPPDAYDHVMYALPRTGECPWAGLADLPGRLSWINGQLDTRVTAHELGHNLGAHHANSMSCTGPGGMPIMLSSSCSSAEYGDPFDVMGLPARLMSSWHRAQIGQLPAGQMLELRESGAVTLTSADDFGTAGTRLVLVAVKEPRQPVGSWLAIETRSISSPFDLWQIGLPVTSGLSVRLVPGLAFAVQSQLLDARPGTLVSEDAPLPVGELLRDDAHGITIRAEAATGGRLRAVVTMPVLVDDVAPTPPAAVWASGDSAGVQLTWSAATDDTAVDHYEIEREGAIIGSTPGLTFRDDRVAQLILASYRVLAVDASGNRAPSTPLPITLNDVTPPSIVPGLRASVAGAVVTLTWSIAQDNRAVRAYRVARSGVRLAETATTSLRDTPGAGTHHYEVRAIDAAGNLGPPSNVDATASSVPAATVTPTAVKPSARTPTPRQAPLTAKTTAPAPALSRLRLSPSTFRAALSGPSVKTAAKRTGTRLSYALDEAASVRFTVERCAEAASRTRCARYVRARGSFTRSRPAGSDRFTFTGRVAGRALKPGRYRLVATPTANARIAVPTRARFRIARR